MESAHGQNFTSHHLARRILQQRSQDIQRHIHTQSAKGQTSAKSSQQQQHQQTATKFAMSSLAAEPLQSQKSDEITASTGGGDVETPGLGASCHEVAAASASAGKKPCFSSGLGEILQFMELIGNLKVCGTGLPAFFPAPLAGHMLASIFPDVLRVLILPPSNWLLQNLTLQRDNILLLFIWLLMLITYIRAI